jgi:hypothetical protein
MLTVEKDTSQAANKWWAAQDARMRNIANKSRWSPQVQLKVEAMKSVLSYVYAGRIYDAYRVKSVAIKIDSAHVRDRAMLRAAEEGWALEGITKTVTPQGVLYKVA